MKNALFSIRKLNYVRVNDPSLPAKPDNRPEYVWTGKAIKKKPDNYLQYIKGGWRYSEQRRAEIQAQFAKTKTTARSSFYPNCKKLFDALFTRMEAHTAV